MHVTRLKVFSSTHTLAPERVAASYGRLWIAEVGLGHRGRPRHKMTKMTFKIRWRDFTAAEDTWEPWRHNVWQLV